MLTGIVLRSVQLETPEAEDSLTQRSPSTSTSTRLQPRLRRSIVVEPAPTPPPSGGKPKLPLELNLVLSAEPDAVICWMMSPTDNRPVAWMSSRSSVRTGAWPSDSARLMRDPVTSTRSSSVASSCAQTAPGAHASATANASGDQRIAPARCLWLFIVRSSQGVRGLRGRPPQVALAKERDPDRTVLDRIVKIPLNNRDTGLRSWLDRLRSGVRFDPMR